MGPGRLVGRPRSGGAWQNVTDKERGESLSVTFFLAHRHIRRRLAATSVVEPCFLSIFIANDQRAREAWIRRAAVFLSPQMLYTSPLDRSIMRVWDR
jgi:hypothetical protein